MRRLTYKEMDQMEDEAFWEYRDDVIELFYDDFKKDYSKNEGIVESRLKVIVDDIIELYKIDGSSSDKLEKKVTRYMYGYPSSEGIYDGTSIIETKNDRHFHSLLFSLYRVIKNEYLKKEGN